MTSSLQCTDIANTQQVLQKFQLNDFIYNPAMFETAEHSAVFIFKFPALTRTLKSV